MTNVTLYVSQEDAETWRKAKKYLAFYQDLSLSEYMTREAKKIVAKYERADTVGAQPRGGRR